MNSEERSEILEAIEEFEQELADLDAVGDNEDRDLTDAEASRYDAIEAQISRLRSELGGAR